MIFPARHFPQFFLLLAMLTAYSFPVVAQEQADSTHKFTLGSYFSSGDFGTMEDTDINYYPISYEYARFPWILSVTAPYISLEGPGDVFLEAGDVGRGDEESSEFVDEEGLGDVFLSATYQLPPVFNGWVFVDLSFQVKLPTADENRDLGTGETDFGYQLDFYTSLQRNTYFSTLGYRKRGKTSLYDLEDSAYATLGYMRQYGERTFLGLVYDYREKASSNSFEIHEFMPFVSYNINKQWSFMVYTIAGFTDSSADRTLGFQLSYTLP